MVGIDAILPLLNGAFSNPGVQSFLISLGASAVWDGISRVAGRCNCDPSLDSQTWDVLRNTMQQFYEDQEYEYDEQIVMRTFCEQYEIQGGISNTDNFRAILEKTISLPILDKDYRKWLSLFWANCSGNQILYNRIQLHEGIERTVFSGRDLVLQRLEAKLLRYVESEGTEADDCFGLDPVFKQLDVLFDNSWKEDLLRLIVKLPYKQYNQSEIDKKLLFIRSNEDCDDILAQVEDLFSLYDIQKVDFKAYSRIMEMLKSPQYNKVLVVTGTTGSGKTFFVNKYINHCLATLKAGASGILPYVVDASKIDDISNLEKTLLAEMENLFGKPIQSLETASELVSSIPVKMCFVIENLHSIIDTTAKWNSFISSVIRFSQYEAFKWLVTINAYEYFSFETTPKFSQRYCIKKNTLLMKENQNPNIFLHAVNMDEFNKEWHVVETILSGVVSKRRISITHNK